MTSPDPAQPTVPRRTRMRAWTRLGVVLALLGALNVGAYLLMGTAAAQAAIADLEGSVFVGSFILAFVTNFTVAVPIPYNPIVLQMMQATDYPWLVAFTTALGATLGETSGYLAGRAGRGSFAGTRFSTWIARQLQHPRRAFWVLLGVSAPPFPAFDVAGLISGAIGVPARIFYPAVFSGRLLRFLVFAGFVTWFT